MLQESKGLDFGKVVQVCLTFMEMMWVSIFPSAVTLPETFPLIVIMYL